METYGLYEFKSNDAYNAFVTSLLSREKKYKVNLDYDKVFHSVPYNRNMEYVKKSCMNPYLTAVLVQYISNPITLSHYLSRMIGDQYVFIVELVHILYQIYSVLAACAYDFTHYDLHLNNVLLYEIPDGKYITMKYYDITDKIIEFKTKYIVKIIDYGRCFTIDAEKLHDKICNSSPPCENELTDNIGCGYKNGYKHFIYRAFEKGSYISSLTQNVSHDLRLVSNIHKAFPNQYYEYDGDSKEIEDRLVEVYDIFTSIEYRGFYGTPEILPGEPINDRGDLQSEDIIYNVFDMHWRLLHMVDKEYRVNENNKYYQNMESAGKMEITLDRSRDLKFTRE